jgi:nucleoside triphosphate pyrophosphatase
VKPVVLASKSAARAAMLAAAGVPFATTDAGVDETALKAELLAKGASAREVAVRLADAKACAASAARPGALVVGADQTLELDGRLCDKACDLAGARARLLALRDRPHRLHSAVAAAEGGEVVWRVVESSGLTMRAFSDAFLDGYLAREAGALLGSVGCYRLEGEGAQLFARIEGDYFAILGLPLLPVLAMLRQRGALAA